MTASIVPASLLTEAVLEAMPIGVAVVDAEKRIVHFNAAYCASLDLAPNSFPPGMLVADALRVSAYRGVYGPGDPEGQVSAFMATDRSRAGRLRRRTFNGRSFDVLQAPLPDGGYVVCAVETTALVAARTESETALTRINAALATLRTGLATFGPDRRLLFANRRFAELLGLAPDRPPGGVAFSTLLDLLAAREEFAGFDGAAFIAAQRDADRSQPSATRRVRAGGQVIDIVSDPLADGGWTMAVTDISALAGAEDDARRRATLLSSILDAVPHGVCVYGPDRRVAMFNRAYTDVMTGAPLHIGDHVTDVIRRRAAAGEYGPGEAEQIYRQQAAFNVNLPQQRKRRRPNGMYAGRPHLAAARRRLYQRRHRHHSAQRRRGGSIPPRTGTRRDAVLHSAWRDPVGRGQAPPHQQCHRDGVARLPARTVGAGTVRSRGPGRHAGTRPLRQRRASQGTGRHAGQPRPFQTLSAPTGDPSQPGARHAVRSNAGRRLGDHVHRRHRGRSRPERIAPRQGSRRGRQSGQIALPRHHEPRTAHASQRGHRLLRRSVARIGRTRPALRSTTMRSRSRRLATICSV